MKTEKEIVDFIISTSLSVRDILTLALENIQILTKKNSGVKIMVAHKVISLFEIVNIILEDFIPYCNDNYVITKGKPKLKMNDNVDLLLTGLVLCNVYLPHHIQILKKYPCDQINCQVYGIEKELTEHLEILTDKLKNVKEYAKTLDIDYEI